jgi:hypothetical protein
VEIGTFSAIALETLRREKITPDTPATLATPPPLLQGVKRLQTGNRYARNKFRKTPRGNLLPLFSIFEVMGLVKTGKIIFKIDGYVAVMG